MPLYTYILTYKEGNYIAQGRHSNFRGFVSDWTTDLPISALPALFPKLRKELASKAYHGEFEGIPNRKGIWQKQIELGGSTLTVFAVETSA